MNGFNPRFRTINLSVVFAMKPLLLLCLFAAFFFIFTAGAAVKKKPSPLAPYMVPAVGPPPWVPSLLASKVAEKTPDMGPSPGLGYSIPFGPPAWVQSMAIAKNAGAGAGGVVIPPWYPAAMMTAGMTVLASDPNQQQQEPGILTGQSSPNTPTPYETHTINNDDGFDDTILSMK